VEDPGREHETAHQVGTAKRDGQRKDGAIAAAKQVDRPADNCLDERDCVLCHQLEGDGPLHVGRVAVSSLLGGIDLEMLREGVHVRGQRAGIHSGAARVQCDQRITVAAPVVPHLHIR
jgi:hypothetical protein